MRAKAVIFDLDGTLVDSLADLADSCNAALAAAGFAGHDIDRYRMMIGAGVEALVRRALPEGHRERGQIAELLTGMKREYELRWHRKTRPYPQVLGLLQRLVAAGVAVGVLSNKPHDFTVRLVDRLLGGVPFCDVRGAQSGVPKKPDPAAALSMIKRMALRPEEVAYLGDTGTDMQTAVAAGMIAVGVLWGFRDAAELERHGAQLLIEHPLALLEVLRATG